MSGNRAEYCICGCGRVANGGWFSRSCVIRGGRHRFMVKFISNFVAFGTLLALLALIFLSIDIIVESKGEQNNGQTVTSGRAR